MQDHVETNFRRCNPSFGNACTHEALRRGESAGILDTLESPQALFEKHLKSLHYTDLAHRYVRIEQANGWEVCVMQAFQMLFKQCLWAFQGVQNPR